MVELGFKFRRFVTNLVLDFVNGVVDGVFWSGVWSRGLRREVSGRG